MHVNYFNMVGIHALEASLSLLDEIGMNQVEKRVLERSQYLIQFILSHPKLQLTTPEPADRHAGIITFSPVDIELDILITELNNKGIQCAIRAGGIRFSPHFYTPMEQLKKATNLLL